jgi:hypothetical protein
MKKHNMFWYRAKSVEVQCQCSRLLAKEQKCLEWKSKKNKTGNKMLPWYRRGYQRQRKNAIKPLRRVENKSNNTAPIFWRPEGERSDQR